MSATGHSLEGVEQLASVKSPGQWGDFAEDEESFVGGEVGFVVAVDSAAVLIQPLVSSTTERRGRALRTTSW
jgi:hypothetical protein